VARVVIEHLTKSFRGPGGERIQAVEDVSLRVEDKEFLVLVGPSGCGKTTTLRLIAGLEDPDAGSIQFDGETINSLPPKDRDVAMVFQNHALYPHLSAFDNLGFGLRVRGHPKEETVRRVREASAMLGLDECLERKPAELSGGQRQRVALGRALVRHPKVFLLDEPLSSLDAPLRAQMRSELAALHRRLGATILHVTHDQAEAMSLGHRIAVMREGVVQQVDTPLAIYRRPANLFVAGFFGLPPMNLFTGTLVGQDDRLFFREGTEGNPVVEHGGCETKGLLSPALSSRGGEGEDYSRGRGVELRLEAKAATRLADRVGQAVVLGIRPENIVEGGSVQNSSAQTLQARAEGIEFAGPETYLRLAAGGHSFVARVRPTFVAEIGATIPVSFDMGNAHFFDPQTGKTLL
jgi:multiple sugar transport system ATP-binding protein